MVEETHRRIQEKHPDLKIDKKDVTKVVRSFSTILGNVIRYVQNKVKILNKISIQYSETSIAKESIRMINAKSNIVAKKRLFQLCQDYPHVRRFLPSLRKNIREDILQK